MSNFSWPARVWEPGAVTEDGKQLWCSREIRPDDRVARRDYEEAYAERQAKRKAQA